ncbi:MAG TPA: VWA domain-containing protein [Clostridia bacterium]|nr:VWA domain-containing protein [Clostridia bacterium]
MERDVIIKQIILITDGRSNIGGDPARAAARAYRNGIIVNTIGVAGQKCIRKDALNEIIQIAKAGGGSYEYSYIDRLFQTMQGLTYKTINQTLKHVVNKQLKEMIGEDINNMEPESRSKMLNYIDRFSDDVGIRCCILLDNSGSMANKIHIAKYSILDLVYSLEGRRGRVDIAVAAFPGENVYKCDILHDFNDTAEGLGKCLHNINPRGCTPTALAIREAIRLINRYSIIRPVNSKVARERF